MTPHINPAPITRRDMLSRCGMGFGAVALADLMKQAGLMDQSVAEAANYVSPLRRSSLTFRRKCATLSTFS